MLKLAWYLITETDYWTGTPDSPRLAPGADLTALLTDLFGDEAGVSAAQTATAVEIMLRMAEHLSGTIPHAKVTFTDHEQFARLLLGLNLLLGYLAQISGRLAHQADTGTGADLSGLSVAERVALTTALATASCRLEESAGLFKEAHLAAGTNARRRARR
jgi:hypothetical protein